MNIGELIKNFRIKNNLTMDDFGKKAGLSKGYISMLEKNENPGTKKSIIPSFETMKRVSDAMGISLSELIDTLDPEQPIDMSKVPGFQRHKEDPQDQGHYLDDETAAIAQEIYDNPDLKILFDASKKATPEDLKTVAKMVAGMVKEEEGEDDY